MSSFSFSNAPVLKRDRCKFDLSHTLFTNLNVGVLKPILLQEVYPGDQFNIKTTGVVRSCYPFIKPIMDNLFIDTAFFFVPYRTICDKWEQCITGGDATPNDWVSPKNVDLPTYTSGSVVVDGVLDNLGVPSNTTPYGVSALPARAVAKIWNEYFRDENIELPVNYQRSGLGSSENPNSNEWSASNYTGKLPKVNKIKDYFTTALRSTQKGLPVDIPINVSANGFVPLSVDPVSSNMTELGGNMRLGFTGGTIGSSSRFNLGAVYAGGGSTGNLSVFPTDNISATENYPVKSTNLGILGDDITLSSQNALSVNDLRYAFAIQKILERSARSGSRYTEYIHSAFGVNSPDSRLQRAEYLGGSSTPLNVQQVASTFGQDSATGSTSLGDLSAYSLSNMTTRVGKAFVEHGYIVGFAWIRQLHTYQQGVECFLRRKSRYDFFDPALQNIGEQPIYVSELYNGTSPSSTIFGYKEAWADMRYRPNRVTGLARSTVQNANLDFYHLGDYYATEPTLTSAFINETSDYVWRAMGVSSPDATMSQFVLDFRFSLKAIRELPAYSVPSLIDHN